MNREDPNWASRRGWMQARTVGFRFANRVDPVWASVAATLIIALVTLALILGGLRPRIDAAQLVEDNRILGSLTAGGPCFVQIATDQQERVWASLSERAACQSEHTSGGIAPYDPVWRVWGDETHPFSDDRGSAAPETLARLGDDLWVAGDDGGLAVHQGLDWSVWLSQSRFEFNGRSISQTDVAAAVADIEGTYFATHTGGLSHYNPTNAQWRNFGQLPGTGEIDHLVMTGSSLWLGRANELWRIPLLNDGEADLQGAQAHLRNVVIVEITSYERTVVVLYEQGCSGQLGVACQILSTFDARDGAERQLLNTGSGPHAWDSGDITFADRLGDLVVLAGPRGVTSYDLSTRSWRPVEDRAITAFAASADEVVAVGGQGFVTILTAGSVRANRIELAQSTRTIRSLMLGPDGAVHASDSAGGLWTIAPGTSRAVSRFEITAPQQGERVAAAISNADVDLFVLPQSLLVRTQDDRRYRNIPMGDLGELLLDSTLVSHGSDGVFVYNANRRQVAYFNPATPTNALIAPLPTGSRIISLTHLGPRLGLASTETGRLLVLDARGGSLSVSDAMPGQPTSGVGSNLVRDLGRDGDERLVLATASGLWDYRGDTRSWSNLAGGSYQSVGVASNGLFASDEEFRLHRLGTDGGGETRIVLGESSFSMPADAQIWDVLVDPEQGLVMLAGDGRGRNYLEFYNPDTRYARTLATFQSDAPGEILHFAGPDDWFVRLGNATFRNSVRALVHADSSDGARGGWIEPGRGDVVTVEEDSRSGALFLHRHSVGEDLPASCLFRGSTVIAPETRELDTLSNGLFALNDTHLVLQTPQTAQLYRTDLGRWYETTLPRNTTYDYVWRDGAFWAQPAAGVETDQLFRLNLGPLSQEVPSCDANVRPLTYRSFEMAAIAPEGDRVLHRLDTGEVVLTENGTRDSTLFTPPSSPQGQGAPLRVLIQGDILWMAFETAIYTYDFRSRRWDERAAFSGRDWEQVLLLAETGGREGTVFAGYADANGHWVRLTFNDEQVVVDQGQVQNPGPAPWPVGAGRSILGAWMQDAALILRYPTGLLAFDRNRARWVSSGWVLGRDDEAVGVLGGALVSWSGGTREVQFQGRQDIISALANPDTVRIPEDSTPVISLDGRPGWVNPGGGLVMCTATSSCREVVPDASVFDPSLVAQAYELGAGLLLQDQNGGTAYLNMAQNSPRLEQIFAFPGSAPSPDALLGDWLTQEVSYVWPSLTDDGYYIESRAGDISYIPADGRRRPSLVHDAGAANAPLLVNPQNEVFLSASGRLQTANRLSDLPLGVEIEDVLAVGLLLDRFWIQHSGGLSTFNASCISPALPGWVSDDEATEVDNPVARTSTSTGTLEPDCETIEFPGPDGVIAHLTGAWDEDLGAQLRNGQTLAWREGFLREGWYNNGGFELDEIRLSDRLGEIYFTRPDGGLSLQRAVTLSTGSEGQVTVEMPNGEERLYFDPKSLRTPHLDLGWMRFDAQREVFAFGEGNRSATLPADRAFTANGAFVPLATGMALPQPEGGLFVEMGIGMVRLEAEENLAVARPASDVQPIFASRAADSVLDHGGIWNDNEFIPFGGGPVQISRVALALGPFTVQGLRQSLGVEMRLHGQSAWVDTEGFLWDQILELGWTPDGRAVARSAVGPVFLDAPLAPVRPADIFWPGVAFANAQVGSELSPPPADRQLLTLSGGARIHFARDALQDGLMAFGTVHLATGRGYERTANLTVTPELIEPFRNLDELQMHRPSETLLLGVDGLLGIIDGASADVLPRTSALRTIQDPVHYQIGPLLVRRVSPGVQYDLVVATRRADATQPRSDLELMPALLSVGQGGGTRLAFDIVREVDVGSDDQVVTTTPVGLAVNGGDFVLSETAFTALTRFGNDFELRRDETALFIVEVARGLPMACVPYGATGPQQSCSRVPNQLNISIPTALGQLIARDNGDGVSFALAPSDGRSEVPISLEGGRFSSDRISQLASCGTRTHFLSENGLLARIDDRSANWAEAGLVPNFIGAELLRCTENYPVEAIAERLWVDTASQGWLAFSPFDGLFDDDVSRTQLPLALAGPQAGDTRLLLRQSSGQSLAYEVDEGTQEALRIGARLDLLSIVDEIGPATEIDLPYFFIALGNHFWAVTPDGIVPYSGAEGTASIRVVTDGPVRQILPSSCDRPTHAAWLTPEATDIYCANGSRVEVQLHSDDLDVLPRPAPRIATVESGALLMVVHPEHGVTEFSLGGESFPGENFDGGFGFDRLQDVQATGQGDLAVVSEEGWHLYNGLTLSILGQSSLIEAAVSARENHPELLIADSVSRLPSSTSHCLVFVDDRRVRSVTISREIETISISPEREDGCAIYEGQDELRSTWTLRNGINSFFFNETNGAFVQDLLAAGRFDGDRADSRFAPQVIRSAALPMYSEGGASDSYCVAARLDGWAITGDISGALRRLPETACIAQRQVAPAHADNHAFFVEDGLLFRRRLGAE